MKQGSKRDAFTYATIVALGGFIFGLDAAVISGTINFLTQEFTLNEWQIGFVVSAPGLGVMPALPLAGYLSNRYGRKRALQLVALLYLFSAVCSAFAPDYWTLVAARFVGGLAFCSLSLAAMYIGEIAPSDWRGRLVSMNQINIVVGLSAAYFINYLIIQLATSDAYWIQALGISDHTWRWMLGAEIVPALLWFIFLFGIPESPSWLIGQNRTEEAGAILRRILLSSEVDTYIQEVQSSSLQENKDRSIWSQCCEILAKPMRLTLIIGVTIALAQQLSGINAILFYAPTVFEQMGVGTDTSFVQAVYMGIVGLAFTLLSLVFIDKIGRRPMVVWGLLWIVLSLGVCSYGFYTATYELSAESVTSIDGLQRAERLNSMIGKTYKSDVEFKKALTEVLGKQDAQQYSAVLIQNATQVNVWLILFGILSFIAAYHLSIGPVLWVLFSEIFPNALRGIAIPSFAFLTSISSYFVQLFFPWQLATMGASSVFIFYAVFGLIGFIILYKVLPETKGLSIEEVQSLLVKKEK